MTLLWALLLAYAAMVCLWQGLERHYKQLWNKVPSALLKRALRAVGWLLLVASFAACVQGWSWAMGPVGWFGMVSLAGLVLILLQAYAPRQAVCLALTGPVLGGLLQWWILR